MKEDKDKIKITWGVVGLGTITLIMGVVMIIQGIEAYKTGTIIPQTTKSGPMTGGQSIITGVLAVCVGLAFLGHELMKLMKKISKKEKTIDN